MANCDHTREELIEAFEYLDELRVSGETNMFGAAAYIQRDLAWSKTEAHSATLLWMETFSDTPVSERVDIALK